MKKSWTIIRCYLFIVISMVVCLLLFGCKTQYVPVEIIRTVTVTKTDSFIEKDSVFCHDSVFVQVKGDTVLYEKWHTKYVDRWRDKVRIDSFIKVDSVQVPYPIERKLNRWEQIKMDCGGMAIGGIIIAVIILTIQFIRWLRRRDR